MALDEGIEYVKVHHDLKVEHGVDGWELDDMTWYPEDGIAVFQYERNIPGVGVELAVVLREQPQDDDHTGWKTRNRNEKVLALTERDWLRWERGIDLYPEEAVIYD